jgi:hypothetical protein
VPPRQRDNGPDKRENLARQYGFVQAFFDTDPELKQLFSLAVKKTWTPERFIAELRDTKWFRTHSVTVRNAIMQKTADPETYKSRVSQLTATVRDQWGKTFGPRANTQLDKGELRQLAETAYMMGWSEAQVIDQMSRTVNYQKLLRQKKLGGTAAENATKIEALGRAYGLNPGNKFIARQIENIVDGSDTFEGVATRLKDWAKREYSAFAGELDGGATIEDIASPYISKMAEMLELNPEGIHARERMIRNALQARDEKGQNRPLSLGEFEDQLRRDKRWQYTKNAREQAMSITESLLKDFGLVS